MPNIAYLNGAFLHNSNAKIHINDRGYQFSDAAYEVVLFVKGLGVDMDLHLDRLDRTLNDLRIKNPMSRQALLINIQTLLQKNNVQTGMIYIQVSRGVAPRNHPFPTHDIRPTFVMTVKPLNYKKLLAQKNKALSLTLLPDNRWGRCDLKTVGLLPNVLAMQSAIDNGFDDALFYDEAGITEGTSWNFWIINADGALQTRPLGQDILWGITRQTLLRLAHEKKNVIIEKPITIEALKTAQAAFATSATKMVMAVHKIDMYEFDTNHPIIESLRGAYLDFIAHK
ncbi:MAG: D-alanine transaminase [Alphaproteobacteria bacterium]|jgi:D-alanine transaminase